MAAKKNVSSSDKIGVLIETSVELQKKLVDATVSMNNLAKQQGELLDTFKEAAKHINDVDVKDENLRPLIKRLDDLLNQNRTIARGLILLESYVKEKTQPMQPQPQQRPY